MTTLLWPDGSDRVPRVTGNYGPRVPFWTPAGWTSDFHRGIDLAGWDIIHSPVDGVVRFAGWQWAAGNLLVIREHTTGIDFQLWHNAELWVDVGDHVTAGQQVALMGTTGMSTGVHCHLEVHINGQHTDPRAYYDARARQEESEMTMTPEQERKLNAIYDAIFYGGSSMPDDERSLASSVAETVQLGRLAAGRTGATQGFYRRSELTPEWMLIDPSFPPHPEHPEQDGYRVTVDAEVARLMGTNPVLIPRRDYIARQAAARERAATWRDAIRALRS